MNTLAALTARTHLDADLTVGVVGSTARVRTVEDGIRLDFDGLYAALRFWRAAKRNRLPDSLSALLRSYARDSVRTVKIFVRNRMVMRLDRRESADLSFARSILWRNLFLSLCMNAA